MNVALGVAARWLRNVTRVTRITPADFADSLFVPGVIVVLAIGLSFASPYFFTGPNLLIIALQASVLAITATGMTFVIVAAELDLSVGSGVALVGVIAAQAMVSSGSVILGVAVGLAVGIAIGLTNGLLTTKLRIPSFVVTLGMLVIARGLAQFLTSSQTVAGLPPSFTNLVTSRVAGVQVLAWTALTVCVVGQLILSKTTLGVRVFAVGGNIKAARLAGIDVDRVRLTVFVVAGVCVGIAGLALLGEVGAAQSNAAPILNLFAIAAVVLGGTSLFGGRGSVARTVAGVLLIVVIQNGLDLLNIESDVQQVVIGIVFIVAASSELLRTRLIELRAVRHVVPSSDVLGVEAERLNPDLPAAVNK